MDSIPQKRCTKCKQSKPATKTFFHLNKREPDGLHERCKECRKTKNTVINAPATLRQCSKCLNEYPSTSAYFVIGIECKDGLSNICRRCSNGRHQEQRQIHHEEYVRWSQEYNRQWFQANKERAYETRKHYKKTDRGRERVRVGSLNYRARKLAAEGMYTAQDIQVQHSHQRGKCYYCDCKLVSYHIDHVVPLTRGGSNTPSNLVLACPMCNKRKHNKLPHEWPQGGRLL